MSCGNTTGCTHNCNQGRSCPNRSAHGTAGNVALLCALTIVCVLLLAYVGPSIDDHSADNASADAIQSAAARDRYLTAAAKMCGINAAVVEQADGSMRCALHNGRKTQRIAMVQP